MNEEPATKIRLGEAKFGTGPVRTWWIARGGLWSSNTEANDWQVAALPTEWRPLLSLLMNAVQARPNA